MKQNILLRLANGKYRFTGKSIRTRIETLLTGPLGSIAYTCFTGKSIRTRIETLRSRQDRYSKEEFYGQIHKNKD